MTYLQLVNAVLRRLREDTATSVSDNEYTTLIGDYVNEVKREVEDSWDWLALRSIVTVTTSASTQTYTLTGAGNRCRIKGVWNDTNDSRVYSVSHDYINNLNYVGTTQQESPIYYRVRGQSSGDPQVDFWPIPNAVESIRFDCVIPQSDFSSDATELSIPEYPVILGAYTRALSERGDDGGVSFDEAVAAYNRALSDAIAQDASRVPDEMVWGVV